MNIDPHFVFKADERAKQLLVARFEEELARQRRIEMSRLTAKMEALTPKTPEELQQELSDRIQRQIVQDRRERAERAAQRLNDQFADMNLGGPAAPARGNRY